MEVGFYTHPTWGYRLELRNLNITEKNSQLPEIDAQHKDGKSDEDVESIWVDSCTMHFIPKNLSSRFLNITCLGIWEVGLKKVSKEDLKGFPQLSKIQITGCDLESLPSDLFIYTRKLKNMLLYRNKIKQIGKHLLAPLSVEDIEIIDLRENISIDACYSKNPTEYDCCISMVRLQELSSLAKSCQEEKKIETEGKTLFTLWSTRLHSDFKFLSSDGRTILAHKSILAAQSPVFAAMFDCQLEESRTNECKIEDISFEAFEKFLEFLYTRQIPISNDHILEVYTAAVKYQIEMLPEICEELIYDNVNEDNALEVLKLGNLHSNELMKILAFKQIRLIYPKHIPESLMNQPVKIQELLQAEERRLKSIKQAQDEFEQAKKLLQIKLDQTEEEFMMTQKKITEK